MTAQEYLLSTLEELARPIKMEKPGKAPLEEVIFSKVMSKKFRKLKADEKAVAMVKQAISNAVKKNQPIAINCIFGGNKLWRLDEAPEIDWAELFNIIYFAQWLKSIASVYKSGARLEYYSEDVVLETMNNLPKAETDQYSSSFKEMLNWIKNYLPNNVIITYRRYGEDYESYDNFLNELEAAKARTLKELGGKLPILTPEQRAATEMNVRLVPGQANDPLWREKVELIHQSIERTETIERYFNEGYIETSPTHFPGCITTGSTRKSLAKFWVGVGALEYSKEKFNPLVLTPKQLQTATFKWQDMSIPNLKGKNFTKIRIIS